VHHPGAEIALPAYGNDDRVLSFLEMSRCNRGLSSARRYATFLG
jgi:hypothetical protein